MSRGAQAKLVESVSKIVSDITGVQLGERQRVMVESRLAKRVRELGLENEEQYLAHFEVHREDETKALISLLTTHHTYFFREYSHFELLERSLLKQAIDGARARGSKTLRIWSAACSRGQEVYSLAMFLNYHLPKMAPELSYEIIGTDVDPESVAFAKNGVFLFKDIKEIPLHFIQSNWVRGTGEIENFVKAKPSIKAPCRFETLNLLQIDKWGEQQPFDLIFCRNVFIYFDSKQIALISRELMRRLTPKGSLFVGISESLNGLGLPINVLGPSVYGHPAPAGVPSANKTSQSVAKSPAPVAATPVPAAVARPLRVLCVDDSPSILALLKKILDKENGFEVVGTAGNGLEAQSKVRELAPDLVTLDIHMPQQTGVEYLEKSYGVNHPPVVIISSVSREDSGLAIRCLELGASDYVEKPTLATLAERSSEIRTKLQCAHHHRDASARAGVQLMKSFAHKIVIPRPEAKLRVVVAGLSDRKKFEILFKEPSFLGAVPTVLLVIGSEGAVPALIKDFQARLKLNARELSGSSVSAKELVVGDWKKGRALLRELSATRPTSVLVLGEMNDEEAAALGGLKNAQILVEDMPRRQLKKIIGLATDVVPFTSYAYMSDEFLEKAK